MELKTIFFSTCSLFIFCTCGNETTKEAEKVATDTAVKTQPVTTPADNPTGTTTDTAITGAATNSHAPATSVEAFIKSSLKDWSIPAASTWDPKWFNKYKKGENTVYSVQADLDGNGQKDGAYILEDTEKQFAVWAFLRNDDTYKPVKIYAIQRLKDKPLHVGLGVLPPGSYADINSADLHKVTTQKPAIHVLFFETASKAYYYENGKFQLIQTGD